jgi:large subunit ribosomal protein L23
MKNPYVIIEKPIHSERSLAKSEKEGEKQYEFKVSVKANKKEIKKAVEDAFNVHVLSVNTIRVKGKPKRVRYKQGWRSDWKKAFVKLREGETINLI